MLCDVHHHRLLPAEQEVADAGPGSYCDAQITIESHEDQHEEVADHHLDDVQSRLQQVG